MRAPSTPLKSFTTSIVKLVGVFYFQSSQQSSTQVVRTPKYEILLDLIIGVWLVFAADAPKRLNFFPRKLI